MSGGYQKLPGLRALLALICFLALNVQAEIFSAKVIVVMDGDTVMVLRDGKKTKIRLANIDAPEKDQAFGKQSRDSLREMIGKKQVQIDSKAVDQYGRLVGLISLDGHNINQEQVQRGLAWEYSHYHSDQTYIRLQNEAQRARRGLWTQANPQAPWQWRKSHLSPKSVPKSHRDTLVNQASPVMLYDMECGGKTRCAQMVSCDEANFYFSRCGVGTLDGNYDGQPCERLCGTQR